MRTHATRHLLIVGSGITGAYAALLAAEAGLQVTLVTKNSLGYSNSAYAQGGITAVTPDSISRGDSVAAHIMDTTTAGAKRNDLAAVTKLACEAAAHIEVLTRLGVGFDRTPDGLDLGLEGAHSHPRILHVGQDATGAGIMAALTAGLRAEEASGRLQLHEHTSVTELVVQAGVVRGARVQGPAGPAEIGADAVLLTTGGLGDLYLHTTNPAGASGDGTWLAWQAGAALKDLEFIQFHPTLVEGTSFMISEALRGEGAVLRDKRGTRFMPGIHSAAELAPRDVVSRAIHEQKRATGSSVYLDARAVEKQHGSGFLAGRFPTISDKLRDFGYNLATDLIPVTPAQHYWMGGIYTDLSAKTTLPGLYAAGESACTGVHGANRLASNSLLEGVVFAAAAVSGVCSDTWAEPAVLPAGSVSEGILIPHTTIQPTEPEGMADSNEAFRIEAILASIQTIADDHLGVVRDADGLERAEQAFALQATANGHHLAGLGALIAYAARLRTESVGAHYRSDFPHTETDYRTTTVLHNVRTRAALLAPANN